MGILLGDMLVRYKADITDLVVKTSEAKGEMASMGGASKMASGFMIGALLTTGAAALNFGAQSVKMAADFQTSMNMLVTSAGESPKALKMVSDGVLQMSVDTATSTKQLAEGMYMVESAGYHGADGLKVLGVGARGAKSEGADLGTVLFTLTGILQDYHLSSDQSTQAMNALNVAVGSGKMHLQDLASAVGTVLPLASSLHVKLEDVLGATASMTNTNTSAALATQHLAFVLSALSAPNKAAVKAMTEVGLTADQVKTSLGTNGLAATLQMIEEHVGKKFPGNTSETVTALKHIMGGVVGWKTELALTGGNMAAFEKNVHTIGDAFHKGGDQVLGWDLVQTSFNYKLDSAKMAVEALMIKIGTALLPVIGKILDKVAPVITAFSDWVTKSHAIEYAISSITPIAQAMIDTFKVMLPPLIGVFMGFMGILGRVFDWLTHNKQALEALKIVAIVIAGALVVVVGALLLLWMTLISVAVVVIGTVVVVVMGLIWVWNRLGDAVHWLVGVWGGFMAWGKSAWGAFGAWLQGLWQGAVNAVVGAFQWLYNHNYYFKMLVDIIKMWVNAGIVWLQAAWRNVVTWLQNTWGTILKDCTSAWEKVSGIFMGLWNTYIAGPLGNLWNQFSNWFGNLAGQAVQWGQNLIQGFINGINNMAGAAGQAAQNVAGQVGGFLGFHSPSKEGPGKDADKWMPNLIKMLVSGLNAGAPQIKVASQNVAAPLQQQLAYPIKPSAIAVAAASPASQNQSGQGQTFILEVDGTKLAQIVNTSTDRIVRLKLGAQGRAA